MSIRSIQLKIEDLSELKLRSIDDLHSEEMQKITEDFCLSVIRKNRGRGKALSVYDVKNTYGDQDYIAGKIIGYLESSRVDNKDYKPLYLANTEEKFEMTIDHLLKKRKQNQLEEALKSLAPLYLHFASDKEMKAISKSQQIHAAVDAKLPRHFPLPEGFDAGKPIATTMPVDICETFRPYLAEDWAESFFTICGKEIQLPKLRKGLKDTEKLEARCEWLIDEILPHFPGRGSEKRFTEGYRDLEPNIDEVLKKIRRAFKNEFKSSQEDKETFFKAIKKDCNLTWQTVAYIVDWDNPYSNIEAKLTEIKDVYIRYALPVFLLLPYFAGIFVWGLCLCR